MNAFFNEHTSLLRPIKRLVRLFALLVALTACVLLASCKKKEVDYFSYVSELRSNILLASDEDFSLRAYAVEKEYPYSTDGVKRDCTKRAEVYLIAPSGDKNCNISFSVDEKEYGGEMSFDNVKTEYYFSSEHIAPPSMRHRCQISNSLSCSLVVLLTLITSQTQ